MSNHSKSQSGVSKIIIVVKIILIIVIGGYFVYSKVFNTTKTTQSMANELTAEDIVNKLKEKIPNIGKVVVYTAETDINELLGRPNQYTSKVQFADNRLSQEFVEENDAVGGTVEVFENEKDMNNRKEYIESISSQASIFAEYTYSAGNALLRLDNELTPEQAKEYEEAFYEIMK